MSTGGMTAIHAFELAGTEEGSTVWLTISIRTHESIYQDMHW